MIDIFAIGYVVIMQIICHIIRIAVFSYCLFCILGYGVILLNSSYDVSRELFAEINIHFVKYWKNKHPEEDTVIIRQSHAGSTRQAMSVLQGLRADVVTYNQVVDIQILHDLGRLIPADWQNRFPNHSSPFYSTMAFLVRKGNPKKIYDWNDLINSDIKIIFPNPKTSGNGRYTYLAAWNVFFCNNAGNINKTRICMRKFLKNVIVFDTGGRAATANFIDRNQGDVLINFESEALLVQKQYDIDEYEIIIPKLNILAEFPVTWIDKNVIRNGTQDIAQEYLSYLYTPDIQKIITKFGYRIYAGNVMNIEQNKSSDLQLFRVEDKYGNWNVIMQTHFKRGGELDQLLSSGYH